VHTAIVMMMTDLTQIRDLEDAENYVERLLAMPER
jgi:hypothetical protein